MSIRKLVQEIQVTIATAERCDAVAFVWEYVCLIEKCDEDHLQFHIHFATIHNVFIIFAK